MEGPPLGPGGEDITWPDQVAPRGQKASSTRKIKPQTSNLKPQTFLHVEAKIVEIAEKCPIPLHSPPCLTPPSFALGTRLPPEVPPQSSKRYSLSSRVLP